MLGASLGAGVEQPLTMATDALAPIRLAPAAFIFWASSQVRTPQLLELGRLSESQAQFEDLFAPAASNGSAAGSSDAAAALAVANKVTKPASHQRNQMNLNAVTEQPADESPVMATRRIRSSPSR